MPARASVRASIRRLSFSEIDDFSVLFRDYCTEFETLSEFYSGDFRSPDVRRAAAERAVTFERNRDILVDVLLEQNGRWGMSEAVRKNIEALRHTETAAVVTGQQVGLLSGPLYTILKAVSTVQLGDQLSEETGRAVVPVFWLGSEDHDFEEISRTVLLRQNDPIELRYESPTHGNDGNAGPVGRIAMGKDIDRIVERVDAILPPTDFKDDLMAIVRRSYHSGATFSDAFATLLQGLFVDTGLIILNSDDARLKRLAAKLFRKEVSEPEESSKRIREVSQRLAARYHAQVQVKPTNLFLLNERGRFPIDVEDDSFRVRDHEERFTAEELRNMLDASPERFSPNVVMRPLMQDLLLPTAAYVAGPSEVAYFAQYRRAYEWAGLPMPIIYPRASVTILESKVSKVLDKYRLDVGDFEEDLDRLFQRVVVETMDVDVDDVFSGASRHLHEAVNSVKPQLEEIDHTLSRAAEATRQALMEEFERLKGKTVRLEKKNHDVVRDQLEKAQVNLFPNGKLQERSISILYFLNKYGVGFVNRLLDVVSTDTTEHQVIEL